MARRDRTNVSVSYGNSFIAVKSGSSGGVRYAVGWHATNPVTAFRISAAIGRSSLRFRRQFAPTMSTPASWRVRAHSDGEWPSYDTGFLSKDIVTIDGRPVFSIRSAASKASASQEKVSAITKSGDSRSWAASCSSNRPRTLSVEAWSLGSYIQVRLRFAATRARDPATSRARRTAARLISPTRSANPVVGSGHNGLVAAAYLAKAGLKVLVLERRRIVGGASVTEEVFPGVRFSRLAYSAGLLRPEVIRDLDLPRFGYEVHPFDPQFFLPFPNGDSILLWNDADRNHRELARFSKRDADAYPKYVAFWTDVMELIEAMVLEAPPALSDLMALFRGAEAEDLARRVLLSSAADLLDEFFESTEVKAMLATATTIG